MWAPPIHRSNRAGNAGLQSRPRVRGRKPVRDARMGYPGRRRLPRGNQVSISVYGHRRFDAASLRQQPSPRGCRHAPPTHTQWRRKHRLRGTGGAHPPIQGGDQRTMTEDMHEPRPDEVEYPSLLLITADPQEIATEREIEAAERFEHGEEVPHFLNFESPEDLRKLLTQRRREVLRSIKNDPPESIRRLAERLDRNPSEVTSDVNLLEEYGIVYFVESGRAKAPVVPYDEVRIEVSMLRPSDGKQPPTSA